MMTEDYTEFFNDDFAVTGVYSVGSVSVKVIIDNGVTFYDEFSSVAENSISIQIPKDVITTPARGATITVGSDVYTLGKLIDDDGFVVTMAATL